jgi:hypothetical protein
MDRDREREKKESGEVVRDTTYGGGGSKKLYLRFRGFQGSARLSFFQIMYENPVRTPQERLRLHYKAQPVNAVRETIAVYCDNHIEHINTCGQNAEF